MIFEIIYIEFLNLDSKNIRKDLYGANPICNAEASTPYRRARSKSERARLRTANYKKCPVFVGETSGYWAYGSTAGEIASVFTGTIRSEIKEPCPKDLIVTKHDPRLDYPLDQSSYSDSYSSGPSISSGSGSFSQTGPCYVDLVIALDLSCMNDDEYALRRPQELLKI